jgi:hypothetical protein
MEEEIEKLIRAREATFPVPYGTQRLPLTPDQWSRVVDSYFWEFSRVARNNSLDDEEYRIERPLLFKDFCDLLAKVNSIIDNADLTLCLTSKYEYIRERRKI